MNLGFRAYRVVSTNPEEAIVAFDPNFLHAPDQPAVEIEDLPPLDFILLSHLHGDTYES
jgi:L-ascorbate metabolism protein UlaG (beta-lactamase superfamily)